MSEEITPAMAITAASNPAIKNPLEGVYTASLPIAGMAWIETGEGIFMIDTLLTEVAAKAVIDKLSEPVKYIVYTHGHMDHVGGTKVFMRANPEVIAGKYCSDRFDKYKALSEHRALINSEQFNLPKIVRPVDFVYPTKEIQGDLTIKLGNKSFELHQCRAETDLFAIPKTGIQPIRTRLDINVELRRFLCIHSFKIVHEN